MREKNVVLTNGVLSASVLLPGCYTRSRYDHSGMVEQVSLGSNSFLSRERIGEGDGLGGVGLAFCFEWKDTVLHDSTAIADLFPQLGVGLLKRTDTSPWLFTRDYPVTEFEHTVDISESCVAVRTLPHLCRGVAVEQCRSFSLEGNSLVVTAELRNVGSVPIEAREFCHNFFRFNNHSIDQSYHLSFPYTILPRMRRGQILIERDADKVVRIDDKIEGYEGLQEHWMKLENDETKTGVLIQDDFPIEHIYSWSNQTALCPETFIEISLAPDQSKTWRRKYSFYQLA